MRALLTINTAGLPRLGENGSVVGVDWRVRVHARHRDRHRHPVRADPRPGSRADLSGTLKESGGPAGSGFRQNKARSVLVVAEVALALVLLVGSALLIRTSLALRAVDPGFDANNVLTMRMSLTGPRFLKAAGVEQMVTTAPSGCARFPASSSPAPPAACRCRADTASLRDRGTAAEDGPFHGGGGWVTASPGTSTSSRSRQARPRLHGPRQYAAPPVVVINEAMAKEFWRTPILMADRS
jgi:hypothetical protein